jgi:hypothetical protein
MPFVPTSWAKGSGPLVIPDVAGFRVSDEERFFVVQIHYDNQDKKEGVVDSTSGILLHTTDTPRQFDAGTSTPPASSLRQRACPTFVTCL